VNIVLPAEVALMMMGMLDVSLFIIIVRRVLRNHFQFGIQRWVLFALSMVFLNEAIAEFYFVFEFILSLKPVIYEPIVLSYLIWEASFKLAYCVILYMFAEIQDGF
jgi:hypothetical protein